MSALAAMSLSQTAIAAVDDENVDNPAGTTITGTGYGVKLDAGGPYTISNAGEISAEKDPSINLANNAANTLTAAGLVEGDLVICTPLDDPTVINKEQRQEQKGAIASAKRKGLAAADTDATYYRAGNTFNKSRLPNPYEVNAVNVDDDENTGPLQTQRPWT